MRKVEKRETRSARRRNEEAQRIVKQKEKKIERIKIPYRKIILYGLLLTTVATVSTAAKYNKSGTFSEQARVAKFDVGAALAQTVQNAVTQNVTQNGSGEYVLDCVVAPGNSNGISLSLAAANGAQNETTNQVSIVQNKYNAGTGNYENTTIVNNQAVGTIPFNTGITYVSEDKFNDSFVKYTVSLTQK